MKRAILRLLVLLALFGIGTSSVWANTITYDLTKSNFQPNGNLYGTVTVSTNGTGGLDVTVDLANGATTADDYVFHSADAFGFDTVGTTTNLTLSAFNQAFYSQGDGGTLDGFGKFTYSVDSSQTTAAARAAYPASNVMSFTVARTEGFTNANQLQFANDKGYSFAAQVALVDATVATGFIGDGPPPVPGGSGDNPVPEPTTLLLLGTGLVGAAAASRRAKLKK